MRRALLLAAFGIWMVVAGRATADDASPRVAIVVHPDRHDPLSPQTIEHIYLRRKRFWDDGTRIVPLNLTAESPLRARFTALVLDQSNARLSEYWNRQYFYGILPPTTLASTEAMRRYVASDRNAIGYLPATEVDTTVRVVLELP